MKLSKDEIIKLIGKYPIGNLVDFQQIKEGFMNYSFVVVTEKGKFILRIGKKTKTKKDLLFEIEMLNHLNLTDKHNKRSITPKYIKNKEKKYVNKYNGHNYTMYRFLEGRKPKITTPELFKQTANFLAKFHNQTENFKTDIKRFAWYKFDEKRADEFEEFLLKNMEGYETDIIFMRNEIRENELSEDLPKGPIHCDVKRENILARKVFRNKSVEKRIKSKKVKRKISKHDIKYRLTGVVDFDNCMMGPYLLDLAISINWFCTDWKGLDYRKTKQFVKHYEEYRKLSRLEKEYLFKAIKYAYISHELVDFYVYKKEIITEDYFHFGRKFFLNAAKNMDRKKFKRIVESRFLGLF